MGVFEKIKNALFEVEYVEVDEPPKKEKKAKIKEKTRDEERTEEVVDKFRFTNIAKGYLAAIEESMER